MDEHPYLIRGGLEGRERLRVLGRVMRPTTLALLERAGVGAGMRCLDVGCGGGDVTFDLASLVGLTGLAVGVDIDATKVELARADAAQVAVTNVEFRVADVTEGLGDATYDVVYARFVLTHLRDPERPPSPRDEDIDSGRSARRDARAASVATPTSRCGCRRCSWPPASSGSSRTSCNRLRWTAR